MTEKTAAAIEAEVEQLMRDIYEPLKKADIGPWMGTLRAQTGPVLLGLEAGDFREVAEGIGEAWGAEETGLERQDIGDLKVQVRLISPTVAFAVCTSPDRSWYYRDGKVDRFSTAETWVLNLTDDGWKLVAGQIAMFPVEEDEAG
jgi:hypothetical protein